MPQATSAPAQTRTTQGTPVPQTRSEIEALYATRSELRDQLSSINARRTELIAQQRVAGERGGAEIAPRIAALDERASRLEQQIQAADEAISAGLAGGLTGRSVRVDVPRIDVPRVMVGMPPSRGADAISWERVVMLNGMSVVLMSVLFWGIVRRQLRGLARPAIGSDPGRRLEQLQQAVDTMAVEVERISEGQRYVAKLLSERVPGSTDRAS